MRSGAPAKCLRVPGHPASRGDVPSDFVHRDSDKCRVLRRRGPRQQPRSKHQLSEVLRMTEAFIYDAIRTPRGRGKNRRLAARGQAHRAGGRPASTELPKRNREPRRQSGRRRRPRRRVARSATRARDIARTAALAAGLPETGAPACSSTASAPRASRPSTWRRHEGARPAGRTWSSPAASSPCRRVPMGSDGGAWAIGPDDQPSPPASCPRASAPT